MRGRPQRALRGTRQARHVGGSRGASTGLRTPIVDAVAHELKN